MGEDNVLNIDCLTRIYPDKVRHNNPRFVKRIEEDDLQLYVLNNTSYICIVSPYSTKIRWSYSVIDKDGVYRPIRLASFEKIIEECDEHDVEGLLFNLDIFSRGE